VTGEWLRKRVTKIAYRIIHGERYEARHIEIIDGKKVRRSKSVSRIDDPREGNEETVDGDAAETPEGKVYIDPLNSVGLDMDGKLVSFLPTYQSGNFCGYHFATPKYSNVAEDRVIAKIDRDSKLRRVARLLMLDDSRFILKYIENRRKDAPNSSAERVRFLRLRKRCNVQAILTL